MSLRNRLALGIIAIALVLAVPLLASLRALEQLHAQVSGLRDREFAASLMLGRIRAGTEDLRRTETALVLARTPEARDAMRVEVGRLAALADSLRPHLPRAAAEIGAAVEVVAIHAPRQHEAALAGQTDVADSLSSDVMMPALARVEQAVRAAERSLGEDTRQRVALTATTTERAWEMSALMLLLATALVAAIAIWLTRSISRPVRELETGMRRVAHGDFEYRLPIRPDRRDEFGPLSESFASMTAQLAELDKLKAEFMSIASHELKTPLNVIVGYVQLLDEGIYGQLSPKQREICVTIRAQADALGRLVQQLLDVSRFEAGAGRLEVRAVPLTGFLDELERAFQVLALQRGIDFEVSRTAALPTIVMWDADRMNEVLGNLLSNAFKFTERGGRVELDVETTSGNLKMSVRDSGVGIPADQLPRVFQKFFQADNQDQAAQAGSGLGLAIAKEIVEAHSGTIDCHSVVGGGTTVAIVLPMASAGAPRRPADRALAASGA
ncbi:MAG TPA: HAMP domain-containing sensor histidine kinase [Gemmatimonadaceae bacterium]|nr:HAMP domain-containing sensor histidine kinase [Gemmatimonadaceae bacterium]